ncbi:MAG: type VI secretion system tip protein VgrG, partial [Gammaproteobacteria bacterium]|nr:type VI secretion system tip protein VgrG [Gammaproteobacteria bacterium]
MEIRESNQKQFFFRVAHLSQSTFQVQSFSCDNLAISKSYDYEIKVVSPFQLDPEQLNDQRAHLDVLSGSKPVYMHGVISSWKYYGPSLDNLEHSYTIVVSSPLYNLTKKKHSRVFVNQNVVSIVNRALTAADWCNIDYKIITTCDYPVREFTVQLNETDLDFIERLLSQAGLFYFFNQTEDLAFLTIVDSNDNLPFFPAQEISYHEQSGMARAKESIYVLHEAAVLLTDTIKLTRYDPDYPDKDFTVYAYNKTSTPGSGTRHIHGLNYKNMDQGQWLANIYQAALSWQKKIFKAESDCPVLTPGQSFFLSDHPEHIYNIRYRVISMQLEAGATYTAKLLLAKADLAYRTEPIEPPQFHHILTATIEGTNPVYAYVDESGCYHLRMNFDKSDSMACAASKPIRAIQPTAHMHFPLPPGTKVAIGFIAGNLDQPIILGTIDHPQHGSPVTAYNSTQNIIRTSSGNEIVIDDLEEQELLTLATREQSNQLELNADTDNPQINLTTEQGEIQAYANKDATIKTGASYTSTCDKEQQTLIAGEQQLFAAGDILQQAGTDILLKAKRNIVNQTQTGDINFTAKTGLQVEAGNNLNLTVEQNDLQIKSIEGSVNIQANTDLSIQGSGEEDIFLGSNGYGITITKDNKVCLKGTTITLNAPIIECYQSSALNASADVTTKIAKANPETVNAPPRQNRTNQKIKFLTAFD